MNICINYLVFYDSELFQGETDADVTSDKQNAKAFTTSKGLFWTM